MPKDSTAFATVIAERARLRKATHYHGRLKQGFSLPGLSVSPYTLGETYRYFKGLIFGDAASVNETAIEAPIGKLTRNHAVGVQTGTLKNNFAATATDANVKVIFVGDVMVSDSGQPIMLDQAVKSRIAHADVFVMNVEAPVNFQEARQKRSGLRFEMAMSYLKSLVAEIKTCNPSIQIVYNIANNHSLDGNDKLTAKSLTSVEQTMLNYDKRNFIVNRTIAAISQIDNTGVIIGGFEPNRAQPDIAVIEKNGVRIGIVGFTDIINNNSLYWDREVARSEDIDDSLSLVKADNSLDYLYLYAHGNLEHSIYPTRHWRELIVKMLDNKHIDGVIGHGPHVPQTTEVINFEHREKLLVHSLGNFFGPKKLSTTGLNLVAEVQFYKAKIEFNMLPIEAHVNNFQVPVISSPSVGKSGYPRLEQRLEKLYPVKSYPALLPELENHKLLTELQAAGKDVPHLSKEINAVIAAEEEAGIKNDDSRSLQFINRIYKNMLNIIANIKTGSDNTQAFIESRKLANQASGKPSAFKKIAGALLCFVAVALISGLAFFSLVTMPVLNALSLIVAATLIVACSTAAMAGGVTLFNSGKRTGLSKTVANFTDSAVVSPAQGRHTV